MNEIVRALLECNADHADRFQDRFGHLQTAQHPKVVTICCSDSRVLQDHIWSNDVPGHMFTCGNIGNRVVQRTDAGLTVSGDVLYPIEHTDTDTVVVVGHSGCGAVTAVYDQIADSGEEPAGISHCLELLGPPLQDGLERLPADLSRTEAINYLVEYNVDRQIEFLRDSDDVPDIQAVGVVYDFQDVYPGRRGEVHVINVDGETDVATLRAQNPGFEDRIDRLWKY